MQISDAGRKLLKDRIYRLKRLFDLDANMAIIANEIHLVEAAGYMADPQAMGLAKASHLTMTYHLSKGYCTECHDYTEVPKTMCKACNDKLDVEDVMEE